MRRLTADVEALANLLPGGRRRPLGGDREPQHLVGVPDEP
jgi:hypothetical protein